MTLKRSWVESANAPESDFPLNNLPYGSFSTGGGGPRCGVAIGDQILDATALEAAGLVKAQGALASGNWTAFMSLGPDAWASLRGDLMAVLAEGSDNAGAIEGMLVPMAEATLHISR